MSEGKPGKLIIRTGTINGKPPTGKVTCEVYATASNTVKDCKLEGSLDDVVNVWLWVQKESVGQLEHRASALEKQVAALEGRVKKLETDNHLHNMTLHIHNEILDSIVSKKVIHPVAQ